MSWRTVVISGHTKLDLNLGYMVVRKPDSIKKVFLDEISILVIETTRASITTALISEMTKRNIKIIFCDEKHNPETETVATYGCHDSSLKIKQQLQWDEGAKKSVWTEIVIEKIRQQAKHLKSLDKCESAEMLNNYILEMKYYDESNREGHAAKVYFNSLFGQEFNRSKDCVINVALNYGYGILLSIFSREIIASGYLTQIGIFHSNMYNKYNLASDFMEPFRVLVDKVIVQNAFDKFEHAEKMIVLNFLNGYVRIGGQMNTVLNAIKIYCRSLLDAINENDVSLIKFYNYDI